MGLVAWVATITSLVYLYFAIRNKAICFVFGAISALFWAYESYVHLLLKFDAGLQIFYLVMSLVGLYRWKYGGDNSEEKPITAQSIRTHLFIIVTILIVSLGFWKGSTYMTNIAMPGLDAITTVTLIAGTLLLVERKLYSWIYLVVADIVYIYIYGKQGAWLFVGMMVIYTIFGIVGFINWKNIFKKNITLPQQF